MSQFLRPGWELDVRVFFSVAFIGTVLLVAGACDSTGLGVPKGRGQIIATLSSPNGNEASAVFEITGGTDLSVVSAVGGETFHQHSVGSSRVVVILDEPGVIRFQVETEDVSDLPSVSVIQVADGLNQLRSSLSGYEVHIEGTKFSSNGGGD
jgi:hypothetical protein